MRIPANPHRTVVLSLTLLLLASLTLLPDAAKAQDAVDYAVQSESKLWVEGTSTKSDWTVHAAAVDGSFGIAEGQNVTSGTISVESAKMESRKSTIMDRLMYDALKVKEHPTVSYVLTEATPAGTGEDGSVTLNTTGKLTLGGTTNDVQIEVVGTPTADGKIRFTGSYPLKMSDYGMKAPTAMFGALRTGDDVTVHFDVVAAPVN